MKEVAHDAALLVNPRNVREITNALVSLAEDERLRRSLSRKGLARAAEFSWEKTARLTLEAYREAAAPSRASRRAVVAERKKDLPDVIQKTIDYAFLFQYPLLPGELHERLFDVQADEREFTAALKSLGYRPDRHLMKIRADRESISDQAIREVWPHLRTLASMPFVRMIAFSGATAHRNMTSAEDIDLFIVVEHGKLWALFLGAIVWAKAKGLRKRLCMNYLISDGALPLYEHDPFTAQQAASLKPVYGKAVYDRFIEANPFIRRCFPNFDPRHHREVYVEIESGRMKRLFEFLLRKGPVQIVERFSRLILGRHLAKKVRPESDVQLDSRRLKLHLQSHRQAVLSEAERTPVGSCRP